MHAGEFDVLGDGVGYNLTLVGNGIHLDFLGTLDELGNHDGMFLRDVGCEFEEAHQFLLVGAYVHGCTRKDVGRTHKNGESYLADELLDILHGGQFTPGGLFHTDFIAHG